MNTMFNAEEMRKLSENRWFQYEKLIYESASQMSNCRGFMISQSDVEEFSSHFRDLGFCVDVSKQSNRYGFKYGNNPIQYDVLVSW